MEELKVFENAEFGSVRTTTVNGEIMFVGKDVAGILGYSNPHSYGNEIHKVDKKLFIIDFQENIALGSGFFAFIFNFFYEIFKNGIFFGG